MISAIITSFHPHTTHLLQPLDLVCFQPYKSFHVETVGVAARTGCLDFEFLAALSTIREQAFKRTTVLSAFRQTGLILLSELPAATLSPPGTPLLTDCVPELKIASPLAPQAIREGLTGRSLERHAKESPFAHSSDTRKRFGIIATLPAPPISKGPTHPLRVALNKHKSEHRQ